MMVRVKSVVPIFRSFDEALARGFYVDFLGFTVEFEHKFEPDTPLYLGLSLDGFELHLSEHFGDAAPGSTVRIDVDDVTGLCKTLNEKAYRNSRPGVQRQSWGYDEMVIPDPFGNKLIFGTPYDTGQNSETAENAQ